MCSSANIIFLPNHSQRQGLPEADLQTFTSGPTQKLHRNIGKYCRFAGIAATLPEKGEVSPDFLQ